MLIYWRVVYSIKAVLWIKRHAGNGASKPLKKEKNQRVVSGTDGPFYTLKSF